MESVRAVDGEKDQQESGSCQDQCQSMAPTLLDAVPAASVDLGLPELLDARRRQESLRKAGLARAKTRAARERGTAMTLTTAAQFASVVTAPQPQG